MDTRTINKNFRIKVNGRKRIGGHITKLVGVKGLVSLVGNELACKMVDRAFEEGKDITVCRLRRGLTIRFYSK